MRVLLDEDLPRQLAGLIAGHEVRTVQQMGWAGLTNGQLLKQAEQAGFDVFLTADQNLPFQQNLSRFRISFLVVSAASNVLEDLQPLVPSILQEIRRITPGRLVRISR